MTSLSKTAFATIMGAGVLAFASVNASAAIVCSGKVCWHAHETLEYPPGARVVVHPDEWHWGAHERFAFREHEGRGYWNGHRWREF